MIAQNRALVSRSDASRRAQNGIAEIALRAVEKPAIENFIDPLKKIAPAIDDIDEVIPEVMDLDASEWSELVDYVTERFDLDVSSDDDSDVESRVEEALNAGVELLRLTQVMK